MVPGSARSSSATTRGARWRHRSSFPQSAGPVKRLRLADGATDAMEVLISPNPGARAHQGPRRPSFYDLLGERRES